MLSDKAEVQALLDRLSEDASLEEIQYHIYVRQKVQRGIADVDAGRTMSLAEAEGRMARWLDPPSSGQPPR